MSSKPAKATAAPVAASTKSAAGPQPEPQPSAWRFFVPALLAAVAAVLTQAAQHPAVQPHILPAASTKPFGSFEEFYPFYLSEHANLPNRRLHVAGTTIVILAAAFVWPTTPLALATGGLLGVAVFPFLRFMPHGIIEGVITLGAFMLAARSLSGSWKPALLIPLCGYTFAWVGHFFFEGNKPATFIYPTYSLMGDFRMWYDVVRGATPI